MNKKIIIGASSSGIYAGINLARNGVECVIFERRNYEKPDKRTLIITPEVLNFVNIPEEIILNRVNGFEIYSRKEKIYMKLKEPDLIIERSKFIDYLEKIAVWKGVKIIKGREFKGIFKDGKKWMAEFEVRGTDKREYFNFDEIIGADGACSKVAKCFNVEIKKVYLAQARVKLKSGWNKRTVKIWFDKRFTDYFLWLIPDSQETGVCGLCVENGDANKVLDKFLKELDLEVIEYESGVTSFYHPSFYPEVNLDGAKGFLVGDAGLQIKMTTVGGTFTGLWGAYAISNSIARNIPFKAFYKELKRELDIHFYIRKVLSRMDDDEYDRLLLRVSKNLKSFFYELPRDRARKFLFNMLLKEPYLFYLGIKKILKFL